MSFWMRSGTLQIGPFKYSLDQLAYEFDVPFEDSEQLMRTKIKIYNLAESTRNSIRKNHPVILNAGYEGDIGVIFVGIVADCKSTHQSLEWITEITATEAMEEWLSKKVSKTYREGIDAKSIIQDQLNIFGIEVSRMELAVNKTYPRGRVCSGPVRDILKSVITSDCKSIFMIRHGQIIIRAPGSGTSMGVLLTPATGLLLTNNQNQDKTEITAPQDTQKTRSQKSEEGKYFTRECLLNHRIGPGDEVVIRDSTLNGSFIVKRGGHAGSRRGDWKTTVEVAPK